MSAPHQPIDLGTPPPETVIEFGSPGEPTRPVRRWSAARFARGVAGDRRVVPLAAALGAVAAIASLVSEWQVTTMDATAFGASDPGSKQIPADLADLGSFGAGYLFGLFLLVAAVVLAMFGPAAGRRYARPAGLGIGGALLALLLALTALLGDQSRIVSRLYTLQIDDGQLRVSYGRGLWCGLFAVGAALVALYLSGRHMAVAPVAPAEGDPPADEPAAVWSWRRPPAEADDRAPDSPLELTVTSTTPFTPLTDDRDKPNGSGRPGISG